MSADTNVATDVAGPEEASPHRLLVFWRSTVGKKIVMGVTGVIGFLYVLFHVLGNLTIFISATTINNYAALLKSNMEVLWAVRGVLLIAILLHIAAATELATKSLTSRPVGYSKWKAQSANLASRTMRWTGPLLGLFIIYHLLHFTTGTLLEDFVEGDVFHNVVSGFQIWWVSAIYIVAMLMLSLHLYHGVWSMCQSLGLNHPRYNKVIRGLATVITVLIVIGFISIPVAVLLGYGS
ncbi:MAG: succinate dehydrogenase cytochrome b subunit [Blastocatellia bacterium]